EQDRRQRRIDEFEIGAGIAGVEIPALQHLLPGPEPQRIVLGLAVPPNLGCDDIGRQRDTADQEQDIERRPQRWVSQHKLVPDIRKLSILWFNGDTMDCFASLAMTVCWSGNAPHSSL